MEEIRDIWEALMLWLILAALIIPGALDFWLPCGFVDCAL